MRLRYILLTAMATFAACNGAVSVGEDTKLMKVTNADQVHSINTVRMETRSKRMLRGAGTNDADYVYDPDKRDGKSVFIEDKLQKALENPNKTKKLYEQWYKSGYSAKKVANVLNQDEDRELNEVYKKIAQGYSGYIKEQRSQR